MVVFNNIANLEIRQSIKMNIRYLNSIRSRSTKKRSRRYPEITITDADYDDDLALLANAPTQAKTLLHSLERAAASIGLHVNVL